MKLRDDAFAPLPSPRQGPLSSDDVAFLSGVGDRQLREAQDYLGVMERPSGTRTASGATFFEGDRVECVLPGNHRVAGKVVELAGGEATVKLSEGEYVAVPVGMLMPMSRVTKREAMRSTVKDALRGGGGAGMLKESRALIPLDGSGQAFGMTLQYDRGITPGEGDIMNYVATRYPGARVMDADFSHPGKLSVALMFERTAQGEVPMVSPKTPMSDKNRGPCAPEFVDDSPGGFNETAGEELVEKTGALLQALASANPAIDFIETSVERDVMGVVSHFSMRASGAPLFFLPQANGNVTLTRVMKAGVSPARGFVAATVQGGQLHIGLHGPHGEVGLGKCAGLKISAAPPEHSTMNGPDGMRHDFGGTNDDDYAIHADVEEQHIGGPGLNVAERRKAVDSVTKDYYTDYDEEDVSGTQPYWEQLVSDENIKRRPVANIHAIYGGLYAGFGRKPTIGEVTKVANFCERGWRRSAHRVHREAMRRRAAEPQQQPQGQQESGPQDFTQALKLMMANPQSKAALDAALAREIAKNPQMLSKLDDSAYGSMISSLVNSNPDLVTSLGLGVNAPGWKDPNKPSWYQFLEKRKQQQQYQQALEQREQGPAGWNPSTPSTMLPSQPQQPQQQQQSQPPPQQPQPQAGQPGPQTDLRHRPPITHGQYAQQPQQPQQPAPTQPGPSPTPQGEMDLKFEPEHQSWEGKQKYDEVMEAFKDGRLDADQFAQQLMQVARPRNEPQQQKPEDWSQVDQELAGLPGAGDTVPRSAPETPFFGGDELPSLPSSPVQFDEMTQEWGTSAPSAPQAPQPGGYPYQPGYTPMTGQPRQQTKAELSTTEVLEEGRRAASGVQDAASAKALAQDLNGRLSAKAKAEGMQVLVPEIGQRYDAASMQIVGTQNVPGRRSGEVIAIQSLGMLQHGEPVGGAKAGVIVAARRRAAKDDPKVEPPELGPQHTYDDPTPRTYAGEDPADAYAGRRQPATGNLHFQLKDLRRRGDYAVATVVWDPERTKMMSSGNVQQNVISFVKGRSTMKDRLDLGNIGRVRVRMLDVHSGIAEVYFRSSEARALPPEYIENDKGPNHHDNLT